MLCIPTVATVEFRKRPDGHLWGKTLNPVVVEIEPLTPEIWHTRVR
jgi:hypothetical protein